MARTQWFSDWGGSWQDDSDSQRCPWEGPPFLLILTVSHTKSGKNGRKRFVHLCSNDSLRKSPNIWSSLWVIFSDTGSVSLLDWSGLVAALSRHAADLLQSQKKSALRADGGLLKPFWDLLSELTGINMLWSQSGSRPNLRLLLSRGSLRFAAWYSKSTQSPRCSTVASKNSTKAWHNHFQMNDYMAAQRGVDAPTSVVWGSLVLSSGGRQTGEDFPVGHQFIIIARWTWAGASTGAGAFIMSAGERGSSTMYSRPH